jgi:hypothetical protein
MVAWGDENLQSDDVYRPISMPGRVTSASSPLNSDGQPLPDFNALNVLVGWSSEQSIITGGHSKTHRSIFDVGTTSAEPGAQQGSLIFHRSTENALALILAVHTQGKRIAGTYIFEVAVQKQCEVLFIAKMDEHPLGSKSSGLDVRSGRNRIA